VFRNEAALGVRNNGWAFRAEKNVLVPVEKKRTMIGENVLIERFSAAAGYRWE
jgi:glucose/arabinose dehydrogenase